MTKSASFPVDNDPKSSSRKHALAADMVYLQLRKIRWFLFDNLHMNHNVTIRAENVNELGRWAEEYEKEKKASKMEILLRV